MCCWIKKKQHLLAFFSRLVAKEISSHIYECNRGSMTYRSDEVTGQNQNGRRRLTRGCSLAHVGKGGGERMQPVFSFPHLGWCRGRASWFIALNSESLSGWEGFAKGAFSNTHNMRYRFVLGGEFLSRGPLICPFCSQGRKRA